MVPALWRCEIRFRIRWGANDNLSQSVQRTDNERASMQKTGVTPKEKHDWSTISQTKDATIHWCCLCGAIKIIHEGSAGFVVAVPRSVSEGGPMCEPPKTKT